LLAPVQTDGVSFPKAATGTTIVCVKNDDFIEANERLGKLESGDKDAPEPGNLGVLKLDAYALTRSQAIEQELADIKQGGKGRAWADANAEVQKLQEAIKRAQDDPDKKNKLTAERNAWQNRCDDYLLKDTSEAWIQKTAELGRIHNVCPERAQAIKEVLTKINNSFMRFQARVCSVSPVRFVDDFKVPVIEFELCPKRDEHALAPDVEKWLAQHRASSTDHSSPPR
jgi:hypothetical protein